MQEPEGNPACHHQTACLRMQGGCSLHAHFSDGDAKVEGGSVLVLTSGNCLGWRYQLGLRGPEGLH